ncbi:MAG: acetyl-CoA carboxylase biotin carboxyl carrier protein [Phycisphaerales bacterium]|nr:acetyl-CoA carboxylase biotin carboxyl carrier protein [Phycisphaerales bacterium]
MEIDHLRKLVELMVDNDLSRIELREGETHILLRRGQPVIQTGPLPVASPVGPPAAPAHVAAPPASPAPAPAPDNEVLIRSPMVGTFYAAPDPESPPYVSIGSAVQPNTVVCLIEAMKVFNELKAEVAGQISRVLVKSGQAVEFDQPLFAVTPA